MRLHAFIINPIAIASVALSLVLTGCSDMLKPEQTPKRVVIHLLKEIGRDDIEGATEFDTPESSGTIEQWSRILYFPDISSPPNEDEENKIDRFIALFYRITTMEETETQAVVHLAFAATDAIIEFPSVANDPMLPNVAQYRVTLIREPAGDDGEENPWLISDLGPMRNP